MKVWRPWKQPLAAWLSVLTHGSFCWCVHFGSGLNWKIKREKWPRGLFSYCLSNKNRGSNHYSPCAVYSMFPSEVCPFNTYTSGDSNWRWSDCPTSSDLNLYRPRYIRQTMTARKNNKHTEATMYITIIHLYNQPNSWYTGFEFWRYVDVWKTERACNSWALGWTFAESYNENWMKTALNNSYTTFSYKITLQSGQITVFFETEEILWTNYANYYDFSDKASAVDENGTMVD